MKELLYAWADVLWSLVTLAIAVVAGLLVHLVFFRLARLLSERANSVVGKSLVKHCRAPSRIIFPLLIVQIVMPLTRAPEDVALFLAQLFSVLLIVSVAWLIVKLANVLEDVVSDKYRVDVSDNLQARRIHTQIAILKKVLIAVVSVITLATVLMTFEEVRHLGTSILASAGIAGLIVGLAAQRSIATLLAGFQIALTGPINIDDVVIVEGEWGRVEEITLTYVVVRIWDLRRLIVPITYFLERSFQNWTRVSADLLGTVFLYVDYTVPLESLREELRRIAEKSDRWDGKVCVMQVTNASERTLEVRALVSAADSGSAWELRCEVREKLVEYIRENYPESLPTVRARVCGLTTA
ncbi:MAG: mechanosensitive ion channel [Candidatus Abyssubacteria bacterium]